MANESVVNSKPPVLSKAVHPEGATTRRVQLVFRWIIRSILLVGILSSGYWLFSSDRYVSESIVLIQNTDQIGVATVDIPSVLGGVGSVHKSDQLLLREYLLSVDMLRKLDAALNLRAHYSDKSHDFASRMWFADAPIEWFHEYYLSRVEVVFDDYAGVLRIRAQAYDAPKAQAIATMLVKEGERHMNELSHALARAQVDFLSTQVEAAYAQLLEASQRLLNFQNQKGLASPKATVSSIYAIIAKLEEQRTELQTQLAALPRNLDRNHPARKSLQHSLVAVERQIDQERAKLASTTGKPLNSLVEEEQRLEMDLDFKTALYRTALAGLEKGRMDAARMLKQVSILQWPGLPEFAMEPRRIYGIVTTLCITVFLIGIVALLKSVILDHVD